MSIFSQMQDFLEKESDNINLKILKFKTWHTQNNTVNLDIIIENKDNSITGLQECGKINKLARLWLKNANMLTKTNLSVGVPGIDRELFSIEDFQRFTNEKVKIELKELTEGKKRIKGFIKSVKYDVITLESDSETIEIKSDLIERANIIPDWDKIMKRAKEKNKQ